MGLVAFAVMVGSVFYMIGVMVFWDTLGWQGLVWPLMVADWVTQSPDFIQWFEVR